MRVPFLEPSPLNTITLDEVLSGMTCDPITLADFEAYLEYQEHTVENLQFVVWFQSYRNRFFALPISEQALSPGSSKFNFHVPDAAKTQQRVRSSENMFDAVAAANANARARAMIAEARGEGPVKGTKENSTIGQLDGLPLGVPESPLPVSPLSPGFSIASHSPLVPLQLRQQQQREDTNGFHSLPLYDVERQPFRRECTAMLQTFVVQGASKELSLSDEIREMVLRDATWNTHPDVFLPIYEQIYDALATQSLPNFLQLSSTNINGPKKFYWYAFGIAYLTFSIVILLPLIFLGPTSVHKRSWRCFSIPFASLGLMQVYSGWKGLCTEVWSRGRSQLRPWDLQFEDETVTTSTSASTSQLPSSDDASNPSSSMPTSDSRHDIEDLEKGLSGVKQPSKSEGSNSTTSRKSSELEGKEEARVRMDSKGDIQEVPIGRLGSEQSRSHVSPSHPPNHAPSPGVDIATTNITGTSIIIGEASLPPGNSQDGDDDNSDTPNSSPTVTTHHQPLPKPRMFGPERPVLDPRIRKVHAQIVRDMLIVGVVWTVCWVAVVCAVPAA